MLENEHNVLKYKYKFYGQKVKENVIPYAIGLENTTKDSNAKWNT